MAKPIIIDLVETGKGFAGGRMALIYAPKNAKPGSMEALTRFLNQSGLRAVPGYHGPNKNQVLRISGFTQDAQLMALLQTRFPVWQQEEQRDDRPLEQPITIAANLHFAPITEVTHFPHMSAFQKFVKENSNTFSGLAYFVGNLGMFSSALLHRHSSFKNPASPDVLKAFGSMNYMVASTVLIVLGMRADNPRDVYTILEKTYPKLRDPQYQEDAKQTKHLVDRTVNFLRNHPWEITSLLFAIGAGSHLTSAIYRKRTVETLAAAGTLTAMSIPIVIPEKGGRALIDFSNVLGTKDGLSLTDYFEDIRKSLPLIAPIISVGEHIIDWIHESPLRAAALVSATSNVGYALASRHNRDAGLAVMSGAYLTGNYFQSQSTKGRGPGFDDVVSAAATLVDNDPSLDGAQKETIRKTINNLASLLVEEVEIVHSKNRLVKGITERLERHAIDGKLKRPQYLEGFLPTEKSTLKRSPFISPHIVEKMLDDPQISPAR